MSLMDSYKNEIKDLHDMTLQKQASPRIIERMDTYPASVNVLQPNTSVHYCINPSARQKNAIPYACLDMDAAIVEQFNLHPDSIFKIRTEAKME